MTVAFYPMHLVEMAFLGFARASILFFIMVGWWKLGYRDGGSGHFLQEAWKRGMIAMILLVVLKIQSIKWDIEVGRSDEDNQLVFRTIVALLFPWIYLSITGLSRALLAKFDWVSKDSKS